MTSKDPQGDATQAVLYVYHCGECQHWGQIHRPQGLDEEKGVCEVCGSAVTMEWDGGVSLVVTRSANSRNKQEKPVKIQHDTTAWQAGYDAGFAGKASTPVPPGLDCLSWHSGYVEGDAKRQQLPPSRNR